MPDVVKSATVVLGTPTLVVGQTTTASADILYNVPDTQAASQTLSWSSLNPAIATVLANSTSVTVTAVSPGATQIRVRVGTVEGLAPLTVQAPAIRIDQAAENAIKALSVGAAFVLQGPTTEFPARRDG